MILLGTKRRLLLLAVSSSWSYRSAASMTTPTALPSSSLAPSSSSPPRIAIVGAGAAGLAAARAFQLSHCQLNVVVFEEGPELGGVWRYRPSPRDANDDGHDKRHHHPMYLNLRTNLPKELMAFREFPFPPSSSISLGEQGVEEPEPSFVGHATVLKYLQDYCRAFQLGPLLRLNTRVDHLTVLAEEGVEPSSMCPDWPRVRLRYTTNSTRADDGGTRTEDFDAVLICNGHYSRPFVPNDLPGLDHFAGTVMHSVAYDRPDDSVFRNLRVMCVGARASGSDIARELVGHARSVYLSDSTYKRSEPWTLHGVTLLPRLRRVISSRVVELSANPDDPPIAVEVDVLLFCTGYEYSFPFVDAHSNLELDVGHGRVRPLLEQLWHARVPNVAFVGLPHSIVPFPLVELQALACRRQWLERQGQDWPENRAAAAEHDAHAGGPAQTGRVEDTHYLGDAQWDYCRTMASYAGIMDDDLEAYLQTNQALWDHSGGQRKKKGVAFPAAPDWYRETVYRRTSDPLGFEVVRSLIPESDVATHRELDKRDQDRDGPGSHPGNAASPAARVQ